MKLWTESISKQQIVESLMADGVSRSTAYRRAPEILRVITLLQAREKKSERAWQRRKVLSL